jgi:hypothetical protein
MFGNDRVVGSQIFCWTHDACNFVAEMPIAKTIKGPMSHFSKFFYELYWVRSKHPPARKGDKISRFDYAMVCCMYLPKKLLLIPKPRGEIYTKDFPYTHTQSSTISKVANL